MPSELQRVVQDLLATIDQIPQLVAALDGLARRCREQAAYVGAMHSSNLAARTAALQLEAAAQACEKAAHYASQIPPKATAWAQGFAAETKPSGRVPPEPPPHGRSHLGGTASRRLADLPKRRPNDKTSGFRLTGDPNEPSLLSGHDEQYEAAKELIREKKLGPAPHNLAIASHVEVKFAILMRERSLTDEAIVINNVPCKAPFGCERYLADILPPGARLTIYAPGYKRTFIGKESQE